MRNRPVVFRLSAALAIAGTAAAALAPATGRAQPPPIDVVGDPPARVGRVSQLSGTVSFHTGDQQQWSAATLNYPVTSANSFWTEPGAAAQIEIGTSHLALDQQTELDIETLNSTQLTATEPQGTTYLRIGAVNPGEATTIRTPRGTVSINAPGRYEVAAGDTERPTTVTVVEGAAQVAGDNLSLSVGPHQTATITGTDQFRGVVGPQVSDPFLNGQLAAENPPALVQASPTPAPARAVVYQPPPVVQQMTGSGDLQSTGAWVETPQYGHVWYPPVESGWVPYRHGHWSYVAPWGWTWVDDARWGFAPYHYGRWVDVDDRWGWVPVAPEAPIEVAPVYSPALVDFVGIAAGVAVGAAIGVGVGLALGGGGRNVGWVPLGYREPYIPPYGGSPGYVNRINSPNFNRNTNIGTLVDQRRSFVNNGTINRSTTTINNYYGNAAGATVAPASVLQSSQPVAGAARPVTAQQFAQIAQPHAPIPRPTGQTAGITPAVARQQNIPIAQIAHRPAAPGPAMHPHGPGQTVGVAPGRTGLPLAAAAAGGAAAAGLAAAGVPTMANRPGQPPGAGPTSPAALPSLAPARAQAAGSAPRPATPPVHATVPAAPSVGAPSVGAPSVGAPSVGAPSVATPSVAPRATASRQGAPGPAIVPHSAPGPMAAAPHLVPHAPAAAPIAIPPAARPGSAAPAPPHPAALPPIQAARPTPRVVTPSASAPIPAHATPAPVAHPVAPQPTAVTHPTAAPPVKPQIAAPAHPVPPIAQPQHAMAPRPVPAIAPAVARPSPPSAPPRPMPAAIQAPRPMPPQPRPAPMARPAPVRKTCPPGRAAC